MRFIRGSKKDFLLLGLSALISSLFFVLYASLESGPGFPLDDAWIHQTFARNLADFGEWSFLPGENSGASTGPLWGIMLSVLYFTGIPPVWGTYLVGFLIIWALGIGGYNLGLRIFPGSAYKPLVMGMLLTLEWHLVWSALSGMETMMLSLLSLAIFCWIMDKRDNWWAAGLLTGLTVWIRPDGLTLIGPVLFGLIFRKYRPGKMFWSIFGLLGAAAIVILPYFLFNYVVAGDIWPNTFHAKQAEYAFLLENSLLSRIGTMSFQILIGIGISLLPGLVIEISDSVKIRDWDRIGAILWAAGYIMVYAWRLPVAYQHGRYIMPVMPVVFLLGVSGMLRAVRLDAVELWRRIISRSWAATAGLTLAVFWALGARSYALDVGVINTEMVQAALWIRQNTPGSSIIAAHDIGALGYFADRQIRDLAGLISPDVIPFFWDDAELARYLNSEGVDYLYTFRDWYPGLVAGLEIAYQSEGKYTSLFGMDRTAVYYWGYDR